MFTIGGREKKGRLIENKRKWILINKRILLVTNEIQREISGQF
jgi:hypothetical protein